MNEYIYVEQHIIHKKSMSKPNTVIDKQLNAVNEARKFL